MNLLPYLAGFFFSAIVIGALWVIVSGNAE